MTKFFRNIRRHLLGENRLGKYMLYATGEIILVVIGIFIAIQLNTLKNDALQANDNLDYLTQLREEVKYNSVRSDFLLQSDSMINSGGNTVEQQREMALAFDSLICTAIEPDDIGKVALTMYTTFNNPRFQRNVYENGINTGALFKLGNPQLLKAIQLYYTQLTDDLRWVKHSEEYFNLERNEARDWRLLLQQVTRIKLLKETDTLEEWKEAFSNNLQDNITPQDYASLHSSNAWLFDPASEGSKDMHLLSQATLKYTYSLKGAYTRTIMASDSLCVLLDQEIEACSK